MSKFLGSTGRGIVLGMAVLAVITLSPGRASAAIQEAFVSAVFNGTDYTYTYNATLTNDEFVLANDFTTLYALTGVTPATTITITLPGGSPFDAASWVASVQGTGKNPDGVSGLDKPGINNISITYSGDKGQVNGTGAVIFTFSFHVPFTPGGLHDFASEAENSTGRAQNIGHNLPGPVVAPFVPEPASLALFALGLPALGLVAVRRKRPIF